MTNKALSAADSQKQKELGLRIMKFMMSVWKGRSSTASYVRMQDEPELEPAMNALQSLCGGEPKQVSKPRATMSDIAIASR